MDGDALASSIDVRESLRVMEWYNSVAGSYNELYAKEQRRKYAKLLSCINMEHLGAVLDVGCGTLELLKYLVDEVYRYRARGSNPLLYIGIDISYALLSIARSRINQLQKRNEPVIAEVINADLTHPPLREDAAHFDLVVFITVLRSCYDVENVVRYYSKTFLKPGGALVFSVIHSLDRGVELLRRFRKARLINIGRCEVALILRRRLDTVE